jgi:hypothetical protein
MGATNSITNRNSFHSCSKTYRNATRGRATLARSHVIIGHAAMEGSLVLGGHVSPMTPDEQQEIEVRTFKDRKAQRAATLAAATAQRPVAVQNVIAVESSDDEGYVVAMPALVGGFDERDQIAEDKLDSRLKAQAMLRCALAQ